MIVSSDRAENMPEAEKSSADLDNKMSLHVNHIYLEVSNAVSNLEDCRKFLFAIVKCILVTSLTPQEALEKIQKEIAEKKENVIPQEKEVLEETEAIEQ